MLHDDGNGVRALIESDAEFFVSHLCDGSISKSLVGLEGIDGGGQEFSDDIHATSLDRPLGVGADHFTEDRSPCRGLFEAGNGMMQTLYGSRARDGSRWPRRPAWTWNHQRDSLK